MKIGLVGNQNSGKTTLFNLLTGMNAKIGNWPGVTIEKKVGIVKGTNFEITDLPGIYSLSPYSIEEEISRNYVFQENPDVIINIVDSTSLERSLYLTTQLLELDTKVIVAATTSGYTAKLIATLKPKAPIVALCMNEKTAKALALNYGVYPEIVEEFNSLDKILQRAKTAALNFTKLEKGDHVILTGGFPKSIGEKTTNFMQIVTVKKSDLNE